MGGPKPVRTATELDRPYGTLHHCIVPQELPRQNNSKHTDKSQGTLSGILFHSPEALLSSAERPVGPVFRYHDRFSPRPQTTKMPSRGITTLDLYGTLQARSELHCTLGIAASSSDQYKLHYRPSPLLHARSRQSTSWP